MRGNQSFWRRLLPYELEWIEGRKTDAGYCHEVVPAAGCSSGTPAGSSLKCGKVGNKMLIVTGIATRVGLKPWKFAVIAALGVSHTACWETECIRGMR